jgi:hypothetical protein
MDRQASLSLAFRPLLPPSHPISTSQSRYDPTLAKPFFYYYFRATFPNLFLEHNIVMAALEVASDPGAGWDEAQCTAALAQLEELQAHVRSESIRAISPELTHSRLTTCDWLYHESSSPFSDHRTPAHSNYMLKAY